MAEPTPDTRRRARILARNAIARVERMVRTREPIEWIKGPGDLPLRRTQGGKEAAALRVLLDLARDGQRWRELRPNGYAVVTEEGAYCCGDREGAVLELNFRAKAGDELRPIFFGPAEPVTPSAEVPGEE